jgi:hypothetical protein
MNKQQMFGDVGCPSKLVFPTNDDGTPCVISKFTNLRARRIIKQIDEIVICCIPSNEKHEQGRDIT